MSIIDATSAVAMGNIGKALNRIATALERAAPAREDRRPQLAWWVGEVERLKDCVTRAERELAEAGRQVDHVMRSISRVERERDEAQADRDLWKSTSEAMSRERSASDEAAIAARASAEKLREALEKYGNHVLPCTRRSIGPAADCTCGFEQAGAE